METTLVTFIAPVCDSLLRRSWSAQSTRPKSLRWVPTCTSRTEVLDWKGSQSWHKGETLYHWCVLGCALFVQLTVMRTSYCGRLQFCPCRRWRTSWSMHRDLMARGGQQEHGHMGPWSEITNRWCEMEDWVEQPSWLDVPGHMCQIRVFFFCLFFSIWLVLLNLFARVSIPRHCMNWWNVTSMQRRHWDDFASMLKYLVVRQGALL